MKRKKPDESPPDFEVGDPARAMKNTEDIIRRVMRVPKNKIDSIVKRKSTKKKK